MPLMVTARCIARSCVLMSVTVAWATGPVAPASAAPDTAIALPAPQVDKGKPLMQAIMARKSTRQFAPRPLSPQDLANLLWAGFGINRPQTGGRTAPSAMNKQEIDLFVALAQGVYRYDANANALRLVVPGDLRATTGGQPFVKDAPCNVIFVADHERAKDDPAASYAAVDAAFIAENIYLYCASEGLAAVVRASVDKKALAGAMRLGPRQEIVLAQTVGYPKQ